MIAQPNDNPGKDKQWDQENEAQRYQNTQGGKEPNPNEKGNAQNGQRGVDNPDLNRDRNSSLDKDRNFNTETEDENDDFLTNDLDDDDEPQSRTDDEHMDDDPDETKPNQTRTGSGTNLI